MTKFGLLFIVINIFIKLFIGMGLWKMAMEEKTESGVKSSLNYNEEQIVEGDPYILRGKNNKDLNEINE